MKSKFHTTKFDMTKIEKLEATQENKKFEEEMVPEDVWTKASSAIPIEFHVELIQQAYDTDQREIFDYLVKTAFLRFKYRRLEVPYITDINLLVSRFPNSNIPNGYIKIPTDINQADLKIQVNEIRNKPSNQASKDKNKQKVDAVAATTVKILEGIEEIAKL